MRKYYLMTSTKTGPNLNPGCAFITHGIRHLILAADPDALILEATLFEHDEEHWAAMLDQADAIILCGNPRFYNSEYPHYWVSGIWADFQKARDKGILIADLFGGAASPLPLDSPRNQVRKLMVQKRNVVTAKEQGKLDCLVCRDPAAMLIAEEHHPAPLLFPCSAFWASEFLKIRPQEKLWNAITIPRLNCEPPLLRELQKLAAIIPNSLPTYMVAHCIAEFQIMREALPGQDNLLLLSDPISLLNFYAQTSHLITARLHAGTPALGVGASVLNIAVDSRSAAGNLFGMTSIPYTSVLDGTVNGSFHEVTVLNRPTEKAFVDYFRETIVNKIKAKETRS